METFMAKPPVKKTGLDSLFEQVAQWAPDIRAGICAGTAILVIALFYAWFYLPYREEKAGLEAAIASARSELNARTATLGKHLVLGRMKEAVDVGYEYMRQYLPQENEMPRLVQMVSEIGAKAGLRDGVTLFAPKLPAQVRPDYAEIPFTLKLTGEFNQALNFLYDFSRMNRIVNITEVKIGSPRMIDDAMEILHITVDCAGSTYRGLTEEEAAAQAALGGKDFPYGFDNGHARADD
ncbi:MAG: type 4a pilus biogenesis protein PilO [Candidatus Adiutrix sp.]|jgi:type IV pilus assembly protein PilO|nr:type 4a pilus biogenesis protein PilO [Candidatus Adiutrix sp.]